MNKNLIGIDVIMLYNAQIAFHRLSLGYASESVNWEPIREFREVLSKVCNDFDDPETKMFLSGVFCESHGSHLGRRRTDIVVPAPNEILDELDLLIKDRSLWRTRAERLSAFCHFFIKHIRKENSPSPTPNLQTASV